LDRTINGFKEGLVPFLYDRKWGYLNPKGKVAIQNKYNNVTEFDKGHAVVEYEKEYFVIDKEGNEVPVELTNIHTIKKFTEGLAPYIDKKGNFGFIDMNGKVVIQAQYEGTGFFKSGLAWARTKDGKIGFINSTGEWVIWPRFKTVHNFDEESGLARVELKRKWMYVNKMGELVLNGECSKIGDYSEGFAIAEMNNKVGFINPKQEWIIEPKYDSARNFKNGYAAVKLNGAWGLIDKQGNWVIQPTFAAIKDVVKIN